ncbi:MAG: hypothetical protein WC551_11980 [Patescibacteria group bacterium]
MQELVELVKIFGIPMGLVGLFILRDAHRESQFLERLTRSEEFIRGVLLEAVKTMTAALKENSEAVRYCRKQDPK